MKIELKNDNSGTSPAMNPNTNPIITNTHENKYVPISPIAGQINFARSPPSKPPAVLFSLQILYISFTVMSALSPSKTSWKMMQSIIVIIIPAMVFMYAFALPLFDLTKAIATNIMIGIYLVEMLRLEFQKLM